MPLIDQIPEVNWILIKSSISFALNLEGSFGYIFQPTGYTGYLIELDIEDRG